MLEKVLAERNKTHGDFKAQAQIAVKLKTAANMALGRNNVCEGYKPLGAVQIEALDMILTKISRIVSGDPDHVDSWVDIAGYAQLVVNELNKGKQP